MKEKEEKLTLSSSHQLDQRPDVLPPNVSSPPVKCVRLVGNVRYGSEDDVGSLNGDDGSRLLDVLDLGVEDRSLPPRRDLRSSGGARVGVGVVGSGLVVLLEELDALGGESNGSRSVEGGGDYSLEGVTEGGRSSVEEVSSFLPQDLGEDVGGVDGRGLLVSEGRKERGRGCQREEEGETRSRETRNEPDDESTLSPSLGIELVSLSEELNVASKEIERDSDLGRVDDDGSDLTKRRERGSKSVRRVERRARFEQRKETHGEGSKSSDVSRVSSSGLDDEDSVPASGSTLLDGIASLDQGVQTGVGSEGEVGERDVVGNGSGEVDHRDVEGGVAGSSLVEDEKSGVGLESSDEHERVELVLLESGGNSSKIHVGESSVGTELGTSSSSPSVDSEPVELRDVILKKTVESVVDGDGGVSSREAVSNHLSSSGVHSSRGGSDAGVGREGEERAQVS